MVVVGAAVGDGNGDCHNGGDVVVLVEVMAKCSNLTSVQFAL